MTRGWVRIIGGKWRGRRLKVPDVVGLRPTPDRVRETLFNWLSPHLPGAVCLDAFAGSGALGFEAASRGAARVVMTDMSPQVLQALMAERTQFAAEMIEIVRVKLPSGLPTIPGIFDIVFLDPPWEKKELLEEIFSALIEQKKLADNAKVYLEAPLQLTEENLPTGWQVVKYTRAGEVHAHLVQKKPE